MGVLWTVAFALGNSRSREAGLRDLQPRQHGLATATQLAALGFSPSMVTHRMAIGELERVFPRVYRSTLVAGDLGQGALAAVLWAGPGSVASHSTAAAIWKIEAGSSGPRPEIWVPPTRRLRHRDVIVHRGVVSANDRRVRGGMPVTSAARTLVDLSARLGGEALEAALEDVLHRGLTTPGAIDRCLAVLGGRGRSGVEGLRRLLADRDQTPLESRLEVRVWRMLQSAGLRPVRQFEVIIEGQRYRLDFAWPRLKVAVEADGYRAHGGKLAHDTDRRRSAALVAAGWRVVPVTWADCTEAPDAFLARLGGALQRAARS